MNRSVNQPFKSISQVISVTSGSVLNLTQMSSCSLGRKRSQDSPRIKRFWFLFFVFVLLFFCIQQLSLYHGTHFFMTTLEITGAKERDGSWSGIRFSGNTKGKVFKKKGSEKRHGLSWTSFIRVSTISTPNAAFLVNLLLARFKRSLRHWFKCSSTNRGFTIGRLIRCRLRELAGFSAWH